MHEQLRGEAGADSVPDGRTGESAIDVVLVTGLSGAGRGTAAFTAEGGMGYNGAVAFGGRCALPERG